MIGILLLIPILFPVLAGIAVFPMKNTKSRRAYVSAIVVINALIVYGIAFIPDCGFNAWSIADTMLITFHQDGMGKFFACLIATIWMLVTFFAFEYITHEGDESRYLGFYTMTMGVLMGLCYSGNLITFYMFFELMTIMTVPLVIHSRTKESIAAGMKYLGYSVFGAGLALFGLFFLNHFTGGQIGFTPGGNLNMSLVAGHEDLVLAVTLIMVIGFGGKAGMLPLQAWLPTAHPVAPAPASAVLSGLITKAGVLGIIRVCYYMVGMDFLRGSWVQTTLMILALTTVFMGSMLAFKEKLFKKRLAYSTVSQVSYVLFGLFLFTQDGLKGAMLQVVFHAVAKNIMFLAAGAIIYKTHKTYVYELKGIGKQMPIVMWCFTLGSLSLIGIPPTGGYFSKWFLATGALAPQFGPLGIVGAATLLLSALLTAGYVLPIVQDAFFPGKDFNYADLEKKEPNGLMTVPLIILSVAVLGLGIIPGPINAAIASISSTLFTGI